jgi:hypothetical protein
MSVQHLFNLKPPTEGVNFPDVPPGSPLYEAVQAVAPYLGRQILCPGCALVSKFLPDQPVSELDTAVLLANVLRTQNRLQLLTEAQSEAVLAKLPDAKNLHGRLLRIYTATAIQSGMINAPSSNPLLIPSFHTRAQTAVMLSKVQIKFNLPSVSPIN